MVKKSPSAKAVVSPGSSRLAIGDRVKLKQAVDGTVVAEGEVSGLWDEHMFCGATIKNPYVKVKVKASLDPMCPLQTSHDVNGTRVRTIGDVVGFETLWHAKFVKVKQGRP